MNDQPTSLSRTSFALLALPLMLLMSSVVRAEGDDRPPGPPHGGRHTPPPAAFDACKGKAAATVCEVTLGTRTIAGTCVAESDGQLFCRPEHPPGPPPEAIEACQGKNEGDACSVTFGQETHAGTCSKGRGGDGLHCRP